MYNNLFLDTLHKKVSKTPIWLMRQAGRFLPEYREVRKDIGSFLDLCYSPEQACEVTLQPIRRFDFDAAILFSDILVIPHSLGLELTFLEKQGPILEQVKNESELAKLNLSENCWQFAKIGETVSNVRAKLAPHKALIGFAGAPWTVITYILEGRGKTDFNICKQIAYQNKEFLQKLTNIIVEQTIYYLTIQIQAGADVIQLFDSWSGVLSDEEYQQFVIEPTKKIVKHLKNHFPTIPIIAFPKGSGSLYHSYAKAIESDAIGCDYNLSLKDMQLLQEHKVVQGNLDPVILLTNKEVIAAKTKKILDHLTGKPFIFNLGHGILPTTPIENVEFLVNYIRNYEKN